MLSHFILIDPYDSEPPKRKVDIDLTEDSDMVPLSKKKHIADGDEVLDLTN